MNTCNNNTLTWLILFFGLSVLSGFSLPAYSAAETALFDPTQPLSPTVRAPRRSLVLESTFVSSGRKLAIINGRLLAVGDSIQGAKVIDIKPYEVSLRKRGRAMRLRLVPRVTTETRMQQQGQDNETLK